MSRLLMICFGLVCIEQIKGELNDVTTMYKFNRFESDSNEEQYYNTCSVSVHVDNKLHLPLFNMYGESLLPEIPSLYSDKGTTTWFQMRNDSTTLPLPAIDTLFSNTLDVDFSIIAQIRNSYEMDTIDELTVTEDQTLFENKEFLKHVNNTRTILQVTFDNYNFISVNLYWETNSGIQITFYNSGIIEICHKVSWGWQNCSQIPLTYVRDDNFTSRIGIDMTDNITITDQVASATYKTQFHVPKEYNGYTKIEQDVYSSDTTEVSDTVKQVSYKVKQQTSVTLVSPWLDGIYNKSLFILYSGQESSNLSVYIEDKNSSSYQIQLDCKEVNRSQTTDGDNIVLTKVKLTSTDNWMDQKRIKIIASGDVAIVNVWEGRPFDLYRIQEPQPCVKSNISDIYNTLDRHIMAPSNKVSHCFNGGRLEDNYICSCPPGFAGPACETPCGRNKFGSKCSRRCSGSGHECQGVVLCTPEYGCSCAPGYQGNYCSEQCQPGYYGADCKQECGHCRDECDIYTGHCLDGCNTTYLTRPHCKQSHSYLKSSGKVLSLGVGEIYYQIDFTSDNLVKFDDNTLFYSIQYREITDSGWNNLTLDEGIDETYNIFEEGLIFEKSMYNFDSGIYQVRIILVDDNLETHDPSLTEPFEFELCGETLKVENKTNTSISISWAQETDKDSQKTNTEPRVCHTKGYILEINHIENDKFYKERVIKTVRNSYEIKNLNPGQTFNIKLKKLMKDNEYIPLLSTNVTTTDEVNESTNNIMVVTLSKTKSTVHVEWFDSPIYTTFYVKYKLKKYLPCTKQETTSTLHEDTTSDTSYSLELKDLESNALYELFVTGDGKQIVNSQNISFTTILDLKTWKCNNVN